MKSLSTCKLRQLMDLGMKLAWWLGIGLANCPWHMVPSNVELRTTTSISEPWRRKMYTKISRIRLFFSLVLKRNGKIRHLKTTSIPPCEFCFISCVGAKSSRPPICYSTRRDERQVLQRRYPQRGHKPRLLRHAMWPEAAVFARINTTAASDTHCYRGN